MELGNLGIVRDDSRFELVGNRDEFIFDDAEGLAVLFASGLDTIGRFGKSLEFTFHFVDIFHGEFLFLDGLFQVVHVGFMRFHVGCHGFNLWIRPVEFGLL